MAMRLSEHTPKNRIDAEGAEKIRENAKSSDRKCSRSKGECRFFSAISALKAFASDFP